MALKSNKARNQYTITVIHHFISQQIFHTVTKLEKCHKQSTTVTTFNFALGSTPLQHDNATPCQELSGKKKLPGTKNI